MKRPFDLKRHLMLAMACVLFGCLTPSPERLQEDEALAVLEPLVRTPGVSGHEFSVRDTILKMLSSWPEPEIDEAGNVILSFGEGEPHLLFIAHMDEIGFEVSELLANGDVAVRPRGGFLPTLYRGRAMVVATSRGPVPAVMAPPEGYRDVQAMERAFRTSPWLLDVGTDSQSETEALGVAIGDPVTVPKRFHRLGKHRAVARSMDDRMGCAALVLATRLLRPSGLRRKVTFVWSVEEEIGLNGAKVVARNLRPDFVFAVDSFVSSDSPRESDRYAFARLGRGAVIRAIDNSNVTPRKLLDEVLTIAQHRRIPLQYGQTSGGNDGAVFVPYGAADIPLAFAVRYSHSAVEVIDARDLVGLSHVIAEVARSFRGEPQEKPLEVR
jgi:putative aminopeptidase FrvX